MTWLRGRSRLTRALVFVAVLLGVSVAVSWLVSLAYHVWPYGTYWGLRLLVGAAVTTFVMFVLERHVLRPLPKQPKVTTSFVVECVATPAGVDENGDDVWEMNWPHGFVPPQGGGIKFVVKAEVPPGAVAHAVFALPPGVALREVRG